MNNEPAPQFDSRLLLDHLEIGEVLLDPSEHGHDDLRDTLGYEVYQIQDESGEAGNSVFLVMPGEGDSVEPVQLVGPVVLTIRPVVGEGLVIMHTPGEGVSSHLLAADGSPNNGGLVQLRPGESYAYLNIGTTPFAVRDDSRSLLEHKPHFKLEYERPATNVNLLAELARRGIQGSQQ